MPQNKKNKGKKRDKEYILHPEVLRRLLWLCIIIANKQNTIENFLWANKLRGDPPDLCAAMSCYNIGFDDNCFDNFKNFIGTLDKDVRIKVYCIGFIALLLYNFWLLYFLLGTQHHFYLFIGTFLNFPFFHFLTKKLYMQIFSKRCIAWIDNYEIPFKVVDFFKEREKRDKKSITHQ